MTKLLDLISLIHPDLEAHCSGALHQVANTYVFIPKTFGGQPIWNSDPFPAGSPALILTDEARALVLPGAWVVPTDHCYLNQAAAAAVSGVRQ